MLATQTAMGALIAGLCLFGLWHNGWLLHNSRYGRRLVIWFGQAGGRGALCGFLVGGVVFGLLLACDIIRPIQWTRR